MRRDPSTAANASTDASLISGAATVVTGGLDTTSVAIDITMHVGDEGHVTPSFVMSSTCDSRRPSDANLDRWRVVDQGCTYRRR